MATRDTARGRGKGRERAAHLGPERRRPLVLDAAFKLFLRHGYEGTSMEAIADAAGVTKPVVYSCYPSKEELFKALLAREEERVLAEVSAVLPASVERGDLGRILTEAFTAFLHAVSASPAAYRVIFLGEGGANAAVARRVQRGREQIIRAVAQLARPVLSGGSEADLDRAARLLGHLVVGLAETGARAMLSDPDGWTPQVLGEVLGDLAARDPRVLVAALPA
jgi:AcrR family transcriptional regulator